jgi:hypothetical protein
VSDDRRSHAPRHRGRRSLVLVLAVASLAMAGGAAAAPVPPRAKQVTLTRSTTITWSGSKGVRLVVPADAWLPTYDARLFVRGGTYAFVRLVPTGYCMGHVRCWIGAIDYTPGWSRIFGNPADPGTDHWARIDQDALHQGTFELYLFTDGVATLVFDSTRLGGAPNAVTAAGRVRGEVHDIKPTCATGDCTVRYGGMTRTVAGGDGGASFVIVGNYDPDDIVAAVPVGWPNVHTQQNCAYPSIYHNDVTPDPAAHPYGCDTDDPEAHAHLANMAFGGVAGGRATFSTEGNPSGRGSQYVGFQSVTGHTLGGAVVSALGLWFDYGIR